MKTTRMWSRMLSVGLLVGQSPLSIPWPSAMNSTQLIVPYLAQDQFIGHQSLVLKTNSLAHIWHQSQVWNTNFIGQYSASIISSKNQLIGTYLASLHWPTFGTIITTKDQFISPIIGTKHQCQRPIIGTNYHLLLSPIARSKHIRQCSICPRHIITSQISF
jgi:hypothetical protein